MVQSKNSALEIEENHEICENKQSPDGNPSDYSRLSVTYVTMG